MRLLIEYLVNRNLQQMNAEPEGFSLCYEKLNISRSVDLFASRRNTQLHEFIVYRPEPESKALNHGHT